MDKLLELGGLVDRLEDGMTIGIGGWGPRRKPMSLVREIIRSDLRDLTIVTYGGPDAGMLCASGKVGKLIFGFVSLDAIPLEPYFRKAREAGNLDILELDEGMLQWGLKAAAMRLPFLPTRVGLGTDVFTHGGFETVTSPYDDQEVLLAMPALKLDVALLHVQRADRRGNIQGLGPDYYYDEWFARAAKETFVSTEEVVDRIEVVDAETARTNFVERMFVTGVIAAPMGAHPTSLPPTYGWDAEALRNYAASAGEEDGWVRYRREVIGNDEASYLKKAGGVDHITQLPLPIF